MERFDWILKSEQIRRLLLSDRTTFKSVRGRSNNQVLQHQQLPPATLSAELSQFYGGLCSNYIKLYND